MRTRFGMREFRLDHETGRAMLNGRPYFLRGSNVTLYRFFEDPQCADHPWREDWVRRLHREFKGMHWNALRYCIGFPPEMWYRVADEEGILIQDEFPIWGGGRGRWPEELTGERLTQEYTEWMQERWNHPCVVIWDAQNETRTEETGKARQAVRNLDLSNRPWDNGYGLPGSPDDCFESHPYLFNSPKFKLSGLARVSGVPKGNARANTGNNPIIINEYDWLWLNRDGSPTTLSRKVYANLLGTNATPAQRWHLNARYNAALTEFWRAHRACAGVLHFCGLGYSRTNGQTCDNFIDIEKLRFEPEFQRYMADAFAPVGLMIDEWRSQLPAGKELDVPVVVINDLYQDWKGKVRLRLLRGRKVLERTNPRLRSGCVGADEVELLRAPCPASRETINSRRLCCTPARSRCAACAISKWERAGIIRKTGSPEANRSKPRPLTSSQATITAPRMPWTGCPTPAGHPNSATPNGWPLILALPPRSPASCWIGKWPAPRAMPSRSPWTAAPGRTSIPRPRQRRHGGHQDSRRLLLAGSAFTGPSGPRHSGIRSGRSKCFRKRRPAAPRRQCRRYRLEVPARIAQTKRREPMLAPRK